MTARRRARLRAGSRAASIVALASLGALVALGSACAPAEQGRPRVARREVAPRWQDIFDGSPEIYVVVRPQAIKRDAVYGALFRNVLRLAQARTMMRGVTAIEVLEGCDELVLALRKGDGLEHAAMVLRGVPASLDPERMTDAAGAPVFRLVDARARVPEYERVGGGEAGAVFVLPGRTWLGASGEIRERARHVFASPIGRPEPETDSRALAAVRLDGRALSRVPRLEASALARRITAGLRSATLSLAPGKAGLVARLEYDEDEGRARAEEHVRDVLGALAAKPPRAGAAEGRLSSDEPPPRQAAPEWLEWLKTADVSHDGKTLVVSLPVPARLLDALPRVTGRDLEP